MRIRILASWLMALAMAFGAVSASAVFIQGAITMSGDFAPTGGSGLADATGIDFLGDDFQVDGATGDFASGGVGAGDVGFFQDFQFDPLIPDPVDPLWAIAGFEFQQARDAPQKAGFAASLRPLDDEKVTGL